MRATPLTDRRLTRRRSLLPTSARRIPLRQFLCSRLPGGGRRCAPARRATRAPSRSVRRKTRTSAAAAVAPLNRSTRFNEFNFIQLPIIPVLPNSRTSLRTRPLWHPEGKTNHRMNIYDRFIIKIYAKLRIDDFLFVALVAYQRFLNLADVENRPFHGYHSSFFPLYNTFSVFIIHCTLLYSFFDRQTSQNVIYVTKIFMLQKFVQ